MALAIFEHDPSDISGSIYRLDLGKNRYYSIAIGESTNSNLYGLRIIEDPNFVSDLIGPLAESALGRSVVDLSPYIADRKAKFAQIMSFATADKVGPAYSSVVRLVGIPRDEKSLELPAISFSQDREMQTNYDVSRVKSFSYRESRLSEPMFLNAISSMLPTLLPVVGQVVGGLFGRSRGGSTQSGANPLAALGNPDVIQQILQLIGRLSGNSEGSTASPPAVTAPAAAPPPATSPPAGPPFSTQSAVLAKALSEHPYASCQYQYAEAQVAPALLAALPALMPLLQQVLTPETVQSLIDAPSRHVGTLINGAKDIAKLGLESAEQDYQHLRALNPGVNDPALDALLASMSLGIGDMRYEAKYKRVSSVRLDFAEVKSTKLFGRTVIPYLHKRELAFPIRIDTPKPIGKSVLDLVIKNAKSLKIVHRKRYQLQGLTTGLLPTVTKLTTTEAAKLHPNSSYIVCATVIWKNKSGKKRGTSIQQEILIVGDYSFDRVEESGQLISLIDAERFRPFWHKVWEGRFTKDFKRLDTKLRYLYILDPESSDNARLETVSRLQQEVGRRTGLMKSGMELSLQALNKIIPSLDTGLRQLDDMQLQSLGRLDFAERFNKSAQYHIRLRGRPSDNAAIWVYPEVKLQTIVLRRAETANGNGNVVSFVDQTVRFPMPALIHVIGVRSE